ncbi:MAG: hypothetical protein BWY70_00371 [Bacteroidetes bacterium ADurb.Bin408]|nr:MAG: hypothetical protein BWY70_00371 [Bacteroidetes bacterium ADurb.Bin408]
MKNTFVLLIVAVMVIPMLDSCKKGSEDPFITLLPGHCA